MKSFAVFVVFVCVAINCWCLYSIGYSNGRISVHQTNIEALEELEKARLSLDKARGDRAVCDERINSAEIQVQRLIEKCSIK